MKAAITKNTKPVSLLIRFLFKEPGSHFIVVFDDMLAFHSNLTGLQVAWWPDLKAHNTVVEELVPIDELNLKEEEALYKELIQLRAKKEKITSLIGSMWDYAAAFYLLYRGVLHRFFGKELPTTNPWNNKSWFLCSEVSGIFGMIDESIDTSAKTPCQIGALLVDSGKFRSVSG